MLLCWIRLWVYSYQYKTVDGVFPQVLWATLVLFIGQKVCFKFPKRYSSGEWNKIFLNFLERGWPRELYQILIFDMIFLSDFRDSTILGISENVSGHFRTLTPTSKALEVLVEWKAQFFCQGHSLIFYQILRSSEHWPFYNHPYCVFKQVFMLICAACAGSV